MGEFYKIAEIVLNTIEGNYRESKDKNGEIIRKGIMIDEIRDRVSSSIGTDINFYPGIPGSPCHDLAVFVSLASPLTFHHNVRGRKDLNYEEAIEKIVQHVQGSCVGQTKKAVFVTDFWDNNAFSKWKANLVQISKTSYFEIYLIAGRAINQIKI